MPLRNDLKTVHAKQVKAMTLIRYQGRTGLLVHVAAVRNEAVIF
jgi:hypothetical protein